MIKFNYQEDTKYITFEVIGHADYTVFGFDAVCGMVSVLAQTALYGCEKYAKAVDVQMDNGYLKFKCRKTDMVGIPIMESCAKGIKEVQAQFPQCFE
jgi:uncharacterized protein YsxB (DUF464 family)